MSAIVGENGFSSWEEQLQSAIGKALVNLDSRWWDCVRSPLSTSTSQSDSNSPFFQLGKRLGQFLIDPSLAQEAVASKLALLKETEAIRAKKRLGTLDAEAATIMTRLLPSFDGEKQRSLRSRDTIEARAPKPGWRGNIWEILFYFIVSVALFAAEFSLATQITQEALLLRNPWVFSLALASLTLAFKFLADRFFSKTKASGLIYIIIMIVLFLVLMVPVSILRTETVLNNVDDSGFASGGVKWNTGEGSPQGEDPMGAAEKPSASSSDAGEGRRSVRGLVSTSQYLKAAFFLSAVLFPLLSGAGFSRFQRSLAKLLAEKERRRQLIRGSQELTALEDEHRKARDRLSFLEEETSQIVVTLGESLGVAGLYVYRLTGLLAATGQAREAVAEAAAALSETPSAATLDTLLAAIRKTEADPDVEQSLAEKTMQREYYVRLLTVAVTSRHRSKLDLLEEQLKAHVGAELAAGYELGKKTRFQVFSGESKDELMKMSELNDYHDVLFRREGGGVAGSAKGS